MRILRSNRIDPGLILRQTQDDRNKDPRVNIIRKVNHLIETCLLFDMDLHACVDTLAKQPNIHPLLTIAVWKGLLRENGDFFRTYFIGNTRSYRPPRAHTLTNHLVPISRARAPAMFSVRDQILEGLLQEQYASIHAYKH